MAVDPAYFGLDDFAFPVGASGESVATPTLAIADNEDGTGATATITGADSGATVTVYTFRLTGDLGAGVWVNSGSRTGNGTVSLSLDSGLYWGQAVSVVSPSSSPSNLVRFKVSNGEDPTWFQIVQAVTSRIRDLQLEGIEDNVHDRMRAPGSTDPNANAAAPPWKYPYIVCTIEDESENVDEANNALDTISYPVRVLFFDNEGQDTAAKRAKRLGWREAVRQAFLHQRLPGVSDVFNCEVLHRPAIDTASLAIYDKMVGALTLKFSVRETRGI